MMKIDSLVIGKMLLKHQLSVLWSLNSYKTQNDRIRYKYLKHPTLLICKRDRSRICRLVLLQVNNGDMKDKLKISSKVLIIIDDRSVYLILPMKSIMNN